MPLLSVSAEKRNAVEVALEPTRRVEVFVSKATAKDDVPEMMKDCFRQAYQGGKFKMMRVLIDFVSRYCLDVDGVL